MPDRDETTSGDLPGWESGASQRLDKWLWFARVVKTRSMAAALVVRGRVRVNRVRTQKPSHPVKPGDVITASVSRSVRVLRVLEPGTRRGPASEAQALYEDLQPPSRHSEAGETRQCRDATSPPVSAVLDTTAGRPSKKERREIIRLKNKDR